MKRVRFIESNQFEPRMYPFSVNIHSHLWGGFLFLYFLATAPQRLAYYPTTWVDSTVCSVFLSSAVFCLCSSAFFHVSTCHSEEVLIPLHPSLATKTLFQVANRCHALDYSGIVVLTVGSFYPCIYYGFFCEPPLQVLYIGSITLVGIGMY